MKKKPPHISIIIPTYNAGVTISAALKSIKNQTFEDFEVIIIDGLSNDNTLEIARAYESYFRNFTLISEADKGIYDAMNKGIELARGKWLYFMGSDDSLYEHNTLQKLFSYPEIKDYDVIYGNVHSTRFDYPYDGEFSYSKFAKKNICHQSILFKENVFKKIGKFNIKYRALADYDHNIRWFYSSRISKTYVNQIIANYSDGGFSSLNIDEKFHEVKDLKILKNGLNKLPKNILRDICENALIQAKKENSFFLYSFLKIIKTALKIEKSIKYRLSNKHF